MANSSFSQRKKKRRSSLFVDRPPSSINDSRDSSTTSSASCEGQLSNYIQQLKGCKRSWKVHEKQLKSLLNSTETLDAQCKMHGEVKNNYLDYLSEDDKKFMKEMSPLLEGSTNDMKIQTLKENVQLLVATYEECKKHATLLFENINDAHRFCVSKKFTEFSSAGDSNLPELDLGDFRVGGNVLPVLEYDSELSDFDE